MTKLIYKHGHLFFLILIIVIAIFFRFWQFGSVPMGLYQDEAMNGADALSSLNSNNFKVFYQNNNGREGMIIWLNALAIKLFGTKPWVLRLFSAVAGVFAVLGLYFLAKLLFNWQIALASSFFMAVSFWAVNFSRIGFRANLMLPFLIWSFYFLLRGFEINKIVPSPGSPNRGIFSLANRSLAWRIRNFIIAGILFGLGFYTYIAYRFAVVLALIVFGLLLFENKSPTFAKASAGKEKLWIGIFIFTAAAFIVALPIGIYFLHNPGDFFGRASEVAIWSQKYPISAGVINIGKTLAMFNIIGDFNWRHNYAGKPELFWPIGILFLFGIYTGIKYFKFNGKFLLIWLLVFLLPDFLTIEGNPHALRALGAMPATMIFSGIGLIWLYEKINNYIDSKIKLPDFKQYGSQLIRIKKEIFWLFIIFLIFTASFEFDKYFYLWAFNPNTASAFSANQVEIANYLNSLPPNVEKYAIWPSNDRPTDNGLPVSAQTVYFITAGKSKIHYINSDEINKINLGKNGTAIVPLYFDSELFHNLNKKFLKSKIEFIYVNTPVLLVP